MQKIIVKFLTYIIIITFLPQNIALANDPSTLMPDNKKIIAAIVNLLKLDKGDGQHSIDAWEQFNDPILLQTAIKTLTTAQKAELKAYLVKNKGLIPDFVAQIFSKLLNDNHPTLSLLESDGEGHGFGREETIQYDHLIFTQREATINPASFRTIKELLRSYIQNEISADVLRSSLKTSIGDSRISIFIIDSLINAASLIKTNPDRDILINLLLEDIFGNSDNLSKEIVIKNASNLPRNSSRYYKDGKIIIAFNLSFIEALLKLPDRRKAGWLFCERLFHELYHKNPSRNLNQENEEIRVIHNCDLLLYKAIGRELIKESNLRKIKQLLKSGKYFRFLQSLLDPAQKTTEDKKFDLRIKRLGRLLDRFKPDIWGHPFLGRASPDNRGWENIKSCFPDNADEIKEIQQLDIFALHANIVFNKKTGKGVLIFGDQGVGKSTTALELISGGDDSEWSPVYDDISIGFFLGDRLVCGRCPTEKSYKYLLPKDKDGNEYQVDIKPLRNYIEIDQIVYLSEQIPSETEDPVTVLSHISTTNKDLFDDFPEEFQQKLKHIPMRAVPVARKDVRTDAAYRKIAKRIEELYRQEYQKRAIHYYVRNNSIKGAVSEACCFPADAKDTRISLKARYRMHAYLKKRFEPKIVKDLTKDALRYIANGVLKGGATPEQLAEYLAIMKTNNITDPFYTPVRLIYCEGANFVFRGRKGKILGTIPNLIVLQKGNTLEDGHGYEHIKKRHLNDFRELNINENNILKWLVKTICEGNRERYITYKDALTFQTTAFSIYDRETSQIFTAIVSGASTIITFFPEYYDDELSGLINVHPGKAFILLKLLTGHISAFIDDTISDKAKLRDIIIGTKTDINGTPRKINRKVYYYHESINKVPFIGIWSHTDRLMIQMDLNGNVFNVSDGNDLKDMERTDITNSVNKFSQTYRPHRTVMQDKEITAESHGFGEGLDIQYRYLKLEEEVSITAKDFSAIIDLLEIYVKGKISHESLRLELQKHIINNGMSSFIIESLVGALDLIKASPDRNMLFRLLFNEILGNSANRDRDIVIRTSPNLPHNSSRYFKDNTVILVFNSKFLNALFRYPDQKKAGWLFCERLFHELYHKNPARELDRKKEETRTILGCDLVLYKKLGQIIILEKDLKKIKHLLKSGKYFRFLQSLLDPGKKTKNNKGFSRKLSRLTRLINRYQINGRCEFNGRLWSRHSYWNKVKEGRNREELAALSELEELEITATHGNVVRNKKTGKGILILGQPASGKSNVTLRLARLGNDWEFISDDASVVFFVGSRLIAGRDTGEADSRWIYHRDITGSKVRAKTKAGGNYVEIDQIIYLSDQPYEDISPRAEKTQLLKGRFWYGTASSKLIKKFLAIPFFGIRVPSKRSNNVYRRIIQKIMQIYNGEYQKINVQQYVRDQLNSGAVSDVCFFPSEDDHVPPAYIIDEIRRREEQERDQDRPRIYDYDYDPDLPPDWKPPEQEKPDERGILIIDTQQEGAFTETKRPKAVSILRILSWAASVILSSENNKDGNTNIKNTINLMEEYIQEIRSVSGNNDLNAILDKFLRQINNLKDPELANDALINNSITSIHSALIDLANFTDSATLKNIIINLDGFITQKKIRETEITAKLLKQLSNILRKEILISEGIENTPEQHLLNRKINELECAFEDIEVLILLCQPVEYSDYEYLFDSIYRERKASFWQLASLRSFFEKYAEYLQDFSALNQFADPAIRLKEALRIIKRAEILAHLEKRHKKGTPQSEWPEDSLTTPIEIVNTLRQLEFYMSFVVRDLRFDLLHSGYVPPIDYKGLIENDYELKDRWLAVKFLLRHGGNDFIQNIAPLLLDLAIDLLDKSRNNHLKTGTLLKNIRNGFSKSKEIYEKQSGIVLDELETAKKERDKYKPGDGIYEIFDGSVRQKESEYNALINKINQIEFEIVKLDGTTAKSGYIADNEKEIQRITNVLNLFQSFGEHNTKNEWLDINQIILEIVKSIQKDGINISLELEKQLPKIYANRTAIALALLNLLLNASQSRRKGQGVVNILISTSALPQSVEITISNDGNIIPGELINKIFEPYFGTKESIGIGLSFTKRVIEAYAGTIKATSNEEEGTSFILNFQQDISIATSPQSAIATEKMYTSEQHKKTNELIAKFISAENYVQAQMLNNNLLVKKAKSAKLPDNFDHKIKAKLDQISKGAKDIFDNTTLFLLPPDNPDYPYFLRSEVIDGNIEYQIAHAGSFHGKGQNIFMTLPAFMELPAEIIAKILKREARLAQERYFERNDGENAQENTLMVIEYLISGKDPSSLTPDNHPFRIFLEKNRMLFVDYLKQKRAILGQDIKNDLKYAKLDKLSKDFFNRLGSEIDTLGELSLTIPDLVGLWHIVSNMLSLKIDGDDYDYCVMDKYYLARTLIIAYALRHHVKSANSIKLMHDFLFDLEKDPIGLLGAEGFSTFLNKTKDAYTRISESLKIIYEEAQNDFTRQLYENFHAGFHQVLGFAGLRAGEDNIEHTPNASYDNEAKNIIDEIKIWVIKNTYPQLVQNLRKMYPDLQTPDIENICKIVLERKVPKEWHYLIHAMYTDNIIDNSDFETITNIGQAVEKTLKATGLTESDMGLLTEVISIGYLIKIAGFNLEFEEDLRARLISYGYTTKADTIVMILRGIKNKINKDKMLVQASDYYFVKKLEQLLGYTDKEIFGELGIADDRINITTTVGIKDNGIIKRWAEIFTTNLAQLQVLDEQKEKDISGVVLQDIKDFAPGIKNWQAWLKRQHTSVKMGFLIDGLNDDEINIITSAKTGNIIFGRTLEEIKQLAGTDNIVYLAREERLRPYKDQGIKLVEKGTAGPVLELSWCLKMLNADDIPNAYRDFITKLIKLELLNDTQIPNLENPYYIKLPRIKDEVLQMWRMLEKGTNYLEAWA